MTTATARVGIAGRERVNGGAYVRPSNGVGRVRELAVHAEQHDHRGGNPPGRLGGGLENLQGVHDGRRTTEAPVSHGRRRRDAVAPQLELQRQVHQSRTVSEQHACALQRYGRHRLRVFVSLDGGGHTR